MTTTSQVAPPAAGYKRAWKHCQRHDRYGFYDYVPFSLSNPVMVMPCGCDPKKNSQVVHVEEDVALAALGALSTSPPSDVVALVCAARAALESEDLRSVHSDQLSEAVEAFASRVCYDDEGGTLPEAHAVPCTCGRAQ